MANILILACGFEPVNYIKACEKVGLKVNNCSNLEDYDGLLLPGGEDIDPSFYGQDNICSQGVDYEFDALTFATISYFLKHGKRVLGICKGMQYLNVYFGGDLFQNIEGHMIKEREEAHAVTASGFLETIYGKRFMVNSTHHQCVGNLGKSLTPLAWADDGVLEGFKGNGVLGVQWHPERLNGGENLIKQYFCD